MRVAYDPADPRRCVLEPGFRRQEIDAAVGFTALALVIGLVPLIV